MQLEEKAKRRMIGEWQMNLKKMQMDRKNFEIFCWYEKYFWSIDYSQIRNNNEEYWKIIA